MGFSLRLAAAFLLAHAVSPLRPTATVGMGVDRVGQNAFARARVAMEEAFLVDGALQDAVGQQMENEDWEGVAAALVSRYAEDRADSSLAELATRRWNETWFEDPRDTIHGLSNTFDTGKDLAEWFKDQQWGSFVSPVGKPGTRSVKDVNLAYVTVRGNGKNGAIVYVPGQYEPIRSFDEFSYDWLLADYSPVYVYTHRGQGESDRLIPNAALQYVEYHRDYVHDLRAFTELVVEEMAGDDQLRDKPLYMIAHSTGGGVATQYFIEEYEALRPPRYTAAAFVTPNILTDTGFPIAVVRALGHILIGLGLGKAENPLVRGSPEDNSPAAFPESTWTHSFTRFKRVGQRCVEFEDVLVGADQHQGLCVWGISSRWAAEIAARGFDDVISEFMRTEGKRVQVPILLMTAGDETGSDSFVQNAEATRFCADSAADCVHSNFPDARHALLFEVDEHRDKVLAGIDAFFKENPELGTSKLEIPQGIVADGESCNNDLDCMSRFCEARFVWDLFGGQCAPKLPAPNRQEPGNALGRALVAAAVAAAALAVWRALR